MNKLKNKIFWVILIILSVFLTSILFIFNYQSYKNEEKNISNNLMRINGIKEPIRNQNSKQNQEKIDQLKIEKEQQESRIFMDYTVYAVILNEKREIVDVINHTQNDLNEESIKKIAEQILSKNEKQNSKVGNLYFEKYSYSLRNDNTLTIIDNTDARERLTSLFNTSLLIFILLELIILCVDIKLTNWIIEPVIQTFEKQKQFIADASHELKTPLAVIIANSEALEHEPNEKKWLNNIKSETERMNNLISDLLDMAKLESGIQEQYEIEDLSKLVERSILTFESIIYENNIKLDYNIEENLKFNCSNNQIKQLVAILLDNAIKHSQKPEGEIKISLKKEKNIISLSVTNKGKEIPKEEQEKIFERFYRSDESRNRDENRYGLGLAIAKNIVEKHNGKITVSSSNGYTTFKTTFKKV